MFDLINGLPVHPLVVHASVVLIPLMSVATILVAFIPSWRKPAAVWIVAANAVVVVIAFVTKQSGEVLEERLGEESQALETHSEHGDLLPWFAVGLLLASILVLLASRRGGVLVPISIVAAIVAGITAVYWTYLTGDSGAKSVWQEEVSSSTGGEDADGMMVVLPGRS